MICIHSDPFRISVEWSARLSPEVIFWPGIIILLLRSTNRLLNEFWYFLPALSTPLQASLRYLHGQTPHVHNQPRWYLDRKCLRSFLQSGDRRPIWPEGAKTTWPADKERRQGNGHIHHENHKWWSYSILSRLRRAFCAVNAILIHKSVPSMMIYQRF